MMNDSAMNAAPQCTPSLQALAGVRVMASLAGHSSLAAVCFARFSQEGQ